MLWIMSIIRTHARNLIFAILDAPASSFQSRSLMFAILDNNIGLYVSTKYLPFAMFLINNTNASTEPLYSTEHRE